MQTAVVNSDGRITIPAEIIRKLGVEKGDKLFFIEVNGKYVIQNTEPDSLDVIQAQLHGVTESVGWKSIDDAMADIKEIRKEIKEEKKKLNANNG